MASIEFTTNKDKAIQFADMELANHRAMNTFVSKGIPVVITAHNNKWLITLAGTTAPGMTEYHYAGYEHG